MAHTAKIKRHFVGQLGAHIDRLRDQGQTYGNENIDLERTIMNYDLSGVSKPLTQIVQEAVDGAPKTVRKDAVVLGSTVVTLPGDWPEGRDPREFFEAVRAFDLEFWPKTYREARATVHMDERTPHMHHVFVPLDAKGQPNFNATYTRRLYKRYHVDLQRSVCASCGLDSLHVLLDEDDVAGKALSKLDQSDYKAAKAAEAHAVERAEAALAEAADAEERAREASERLERLRRDEALAAEQVGIGAEELAVLDARAGERRDYRDSHKGGRGREEAAEREVEELRNLDIALGKRVEELREARGRAEGRVDALEVEVEQARARAGLLARLVRAARRRAVEIVRRMREAGRRVVEAMAATVPDHALRADEERRRAVARSAALWEDGLDVAIDRAMEDIGGDHGVKLSR